MAQVLVVDDSPIDRRVAGRIIEKQEAFTARYACDGNEALALMAEELPHIVVTDLLMPGMDGLELVAQVRKLHPVVPVVLMTAHGSEETAVRALTAGAASYVPKRSLATELAETIESVLTVARGARDERRVFEMITEASTSYRLGPESADLTALVRHLETEVGRLGLCDHAETLQVSIAVREALVNAVEHGNLELDSKLKERGDGSYEALRIERRRERPFCDRRVQVQATMTHEAVTWVIRDQGKGFDPNTLPDPTDPLNLDRVYGRGLLLIRTFMDEVQHNEMGNEITMIKRKNPGTRGEQG
ncbi:MAG: response regulator [Myxococcales bacterium]|nr:response regulator [Myxococcales bacterium]